MEEVSVTFRIKLRALFLEMFALIVLCYVGGWTTLADNSIGSQGAAYEEAFANAGVIFTMVLFSFEVSGAQLNPAVSIALSWIQVQPWTTTFLYCVFQLLGSVIGGALLHFVSGSKFKGTLNRSYPSPNLGSFSKWNVFWHEFIGTFFLFFTILHIVHLKGNKYHMAIGVFSVLIMNIFSYANITGAAFNPARVFGPSLVENDLLMKGWYLYWVGPCLGAIFAGIIHKTFTEKQDYKAYLPNIIVQLIECTASLFKKGIKIGN